MSSGVGKSGLGFGASTQILKQLNTDMVRLQKQLGSGRVGDTYGELSTSRVTSLVIRQKLSSMDGFADAMQQSELRIQMMNSNLDRLQSIGLDARQSALKFGFDISGAGLNTAQSNALQQLDEVVGILNADVAGRSLFAGKATRTQPLVDASAMLNGVDGKAGLKQLIQERLLADTGTGTGRLNTAVATSTVTLTEDNAPPFGFKLIGLSVSDGSATIVAPAGTPQVASLTLNTQPTADAVLSLSLRLPDGTQNAIELRVGAANSASTFALGATTDDTAANINAAIDLALRDRAVTSLKAASAFQASDEFFQADSSTPALRVTGPSFATATALQNSTSSDTVVWYQGGTDANARASLVAQIDANVSVPYGVQANEQGIRDIVKSLAVFSTYTFSADTPTTRAAYQEFASRTATTLSPEIGKQTLDDIRLEIYQTSMTIKSTKDRQVMSREMLKQTLADGENVDIQTVGANILALQTRLEASYRVTAILSEMNLTKFI
jgi:flagellar hook-associated protein 3 FlgL